VAALIKAPDTRHQVVLAIPFALGALLSTVALGAGIYDLAAGNSGSGVRELVAGCVLALSAMYLFRKIRALEPPRAEAERPK